MKDDSINYEVIGLVSEDNTVSIPSRKAFKQLQKDHKALVKRVEELEAEKESKTGGLLEYLAAEYPDSPAAEYLKNKE